MFFFTFLIFFPLSCRSISFLFLFFLGSASLSLFFSLDMIYSFFSKKNRKLKKIKEDEDRRKNMVMEIKN